MVYPRARIGILFIFLVFFGVGVVKADWETVQITDGDDDLFITETGIVWQDSTWISIKEPTISLSSYFCLRNINIPDNVEIDNAYLEITAPFPWEYSETVNVTVVGLLAGDMPDFSIVPDLENYPVSDQFTNVDLDTFHSGEVRNITVTNIVQRINDLWTWNDGNAMCFKIYSSFVTQNRWAESYNNAPSKSAKLYIEYTDSAGSEYYRGYEIRNGTGGHIGTAYIASTNGTFGAIWKITNDTVESVYYHLGMSMASPESRTDDAMVFVGDYLYFVWFNTTGGFLARTNDDGQTVQIFDEVIPLNTYNGYDLKYSPITGIIYIAYTRSSGTNVYYTTWNTTSESLIEQYQTALTTITNSVYMGAELYFNSSGDYWMIFGGGTDRVCFRQRNLGVWGTQYTDISATLTYPWLEFDWGRKTMYVAMLGAGNVFYLGNKTLDEPYNAWGDWNTKDGWKIISDGNLFDQGVRMVFDPISDLLILNGYDTGWEGISMTYGKYPFNDFKLTSLPVNLTNQARFPYIWRYNSSNGYEAYIFGFDQVGDDMYLAHYSWWNGSYTDPEMATKKIYDNTDQLNFVSQTNWYGFETAGGYEVYDNGTLQNNTCLQNAVTIEDIQACIDDLLNGTDPVDPNPPTTTYPEDGWGQITRFNMRYYLWIVAHICLFTSVGAIVYKKLPLQMYPLLFILFMTGLGLLWSLGQV